ncbi:MAG: response regulator [Planctomycetes bacterium]|nr:response regulator [Planctomycetota bacterium]
MNKVLIVDDSSTMRKIIMRVLRQADIAVENVLEAANGVEGMQQLTTHPDIGLILSDVNMPEMNGIDFVKAVRGTHTKERLPVIMVTTEGGQAMVDNAMAQGANGFVCKPFTPESIRSALEPYVR